MHELHVARSREFAHSHVGSLSRTENIQKLLINVQRFHSHVSIYIITITTKWFYVFVWGIGSLHSIFNSHGTGSRSFNSSFNRLIANGSHTCQLSSKEFTDVVKSLYTEFETILRETSADLSALRNIFVCISELASCNMYAFKLQLMIERPDVHLSSPTFWFF